MRDAFWIIGIFLVFVIASMPWFTIYNWVQKQGDRKYKSPKDVI